MSEYKNLEMRATKKNQEKKIRTKKVKLIK